jgi:hypothetical protein
VTICTAHTHTPNVNNCRRWQCAVVATWVYTGMDELIRNDDYGRISIWWGWLRYTPIAHVRVKRARREKKTDSPWLTFLNDEPRKCTRTTIGLRITLFYSLSQLYGKKKLLCCWAISPRRLHDDDYSTWQTEKLLLFLWNKSNVQFYLLFI